MHIIKTVCLTLCASSFLSCSAGQTKHETEVFFKWLAWQQIYNDCSISDHFTAQPAEIMANALREHYMANALQVRSLTPFLSSLTNNKIGTGYCNIAVPRDQTMQENFMALYDAVENNMPAFIELLIKHGLTVPALVDEENTTHHEMVIEKYKALLRILFANNDSFKENETLLAVANRFFEYCYSDATFPQYQKLLTDHMAYPIVRFLSTAIWHNLVGEGWKHWHAQTLAELKNHADRGDEIVYVAGGTDIYHLLRTGIYNITIIDPYLPTQERFYSDGWQLLIADDAVNTEIRFGPACNSIKLKCVDYTSAEPFSVKLSNNQQLSIKKSIITWHVFDRNNNQIGHVIIHRKPVTQQDFVTAEHRTFIMSYDEFVFIAMPDQLNGWGIDPLQLPSDIEIYIKQLRKPITKNIMYNVRIASLLNLSDVRFINLTSDPT